MTTRHARHCLPAIGRAVSCALAAAAASAAQLPVPCAGNACGAGAPNSWVSSGKASLVQSAGKLTVTQSSNAVSLNWGSFNISADGTVTFVQPSSSAIALNRIFQADASQIFGALNANGIVYLLNQNGFLFGSGSTVNVGGLLATSLDLSEAAKERGIAGASTPVTGTSGALAGPAFQPYTDGNGNDLKNVGAVTVATGASISASQGQVFLFAPTVVNEGTISTPGGQTILGAGQRIFLAVSGDPNIRGLLIEVGGGGTVTNGAGPAAGAVGQLLADAGNVTLAGLSVNQDGRISATTTVRSNGSIRLQAQSTDATSIPLGSTITSILDQSGTVTLGPGSSTAVTLQGGATDKTVDINTQPKSQIQLTGAQIDVLDDASVSAQSGVVSLVAEINPQADLTNQRTQPDTSRIYLAPTSTIDVSGASVSQPVSDNSLAVQLRSPQLADFPQQRSGALLGQTVSVDVRQHGTRSDGSTWVGTPLADLSGYLSAIERDVFERNLTGGTISLTSGGSVIIDKGATLNVSGGQIDWQSGYVKTSTLVGADGKLYPIAQANPQRTFLGTLDSLSQSDPHWGSVANLTMPGFDPRGTYQAGYVQGMDAGAVSMLAPAFVLDGTLAGGATRGPLQRTPPTNFAASPYYPGQLYRFADEVPLGGALVIGNANALDLSVGPSQVEREVLENLTFASGAVLPTLSGPGGQPFDPLSDPLPADFVSSLRPDIVGAPGVSRLSVYAEGAITVPAGTSLLPGPGGAITLAAADVQFAGSIQTNGGSVTLRATPTIMAGGPSAGAPSGSPATQLEMAPGSSIDTRGAWVNDAPLLGGAEPAPLFVSGGPVQLLSLTGGTLQLSTGATIDVSGGAWRSAAGALAAGAGGALTISALPSVRGGNPSVIGLGASMSGFGLYDGGTLALTLGNLCLSAAACADASAFRIDPSWLTDFGFESILLASAPFAGGGLEVAGDVNLSVRQRNLVFLPGAYQHASAASLAGLTRVTTLSADLRHPENLALSADAATQINSANVQFADLRIDPGASLTFDPRARVSLATNSRVFMDGAITDPAGSVSVAIRNDVISGGAYLPNQAIWMGSDSRIDVSGVAQLTPSDSGLNLGTVLPGGSVSLSAGRGYLIGLPGSEILAGGTSATLALRSPASAVYTPQTVASAGGSIALFGAEGIQYDGALSAPSGAPGQVPGGSLSIALDGDASRAAFPGGFELNPRILTVTTSDAPTIIAPGSSVPDFLNGLGRIPETLINDGGFDNVSLGARDLLVPKIFSNGSSPYALAGQGAVALTPGVVLSPAESLTINSPEIRLTGAGSVELSSAYVSLGSSDPLIQQPNPAAVTGPAVLSVRGGLIDLVGSLDISGAGTTTLYSSGDIRGVGVQLSSAVVQSLATGFSASLSTPGNLTLGAQQIYPTTLTNFAIDLTSGDPLQSSLTVTKAPGAPGAVLSAAGSLTLTADEISDAGVLRAPIGTIALQGKQSVALADGAVVSVSAEGTTIPFGQTQGGFDWVYQLRSSSGAGGGNAVSVYGEAPGDLALPQKQVQITTNNLRFSAGATIDTSGGGDLTAYEWIPGLGGTRDILSTTVSPGTFAILPGMTLPYAPIDPNEDRGFTLSVGSSVYLAGGGGLPAGTYALLPARYALLPGAYLVRAVPGYTDLAAGQTIPQLDGSVIVSGYNVNAGTGLHSSRTSGFDVVAGTYALREAQYNLTSANEFFAAEAVSAGLPAPRLPLDAGALAISAAQSAQLQGTLDGLAPSGGRGGTVDLVASTLFVTNTPGSAPPGAVTLDVSQLNGLGAESLLLGATRSSVGDSTQLTLSAAAAGQAGNVVELDTGAHLTAPEIILAASGAVKLDAGASVTASGASAGQEPDLLAPAGTAILRASTAPAVSVDSSGAGKDASITVAAGASVSAPGSVLIEAGGSTSFAGNLSAQGAAVLLGGSNISIGNAPAGTAGFLIGPSLIGGLSNADLTLQISNPGDPQYASRAVQVFGPVNLSLDSLTLDAPGLAAASADAQLNVAAGTVTLQSASQQSLVTGSGGGAGTLSLGAQHILLAGGTFGAEGFASTTLAASKDLTVTGDGTLGVSGNLIMASPVIESVAGATFAFSSASSLTTQLAGPTAAGDHRAVAAATTAAPGPGGALSFDGASVTLGGKIVLPAGRIEATANGALEVAGGATLDVSGFQLSFDNELHSAGGGTIRLASATGNIDVAVGSVLNVSAGAGSGGGGDLEISAPQGALALAGHVAGAGASAANGGILGVEAASFDFASLAGLAGSAGFTSGVNLHERGPGDLILPVGSTLRARNVQLTADQGRVVVEGAIDASAPLGGTIVLAGDGIELAGSLSAGSTSRADRGGTVELFSAGSLAVDAGSSINVAGAGFTAAAADAGTVWLRAPQSVVSSALSGPGAALIRLDGSVTGAGHVYLEAYNAYTPTTPGSITATDVDPTTSAWYGPAATFMANEAPAVLAALSASHGLAGNANFSILPGIEIDAANQPGQAGDLHLASPWDLFQWRFGANHDIPGVLTIRAGGSLYIDQSLSDGFSGGLDPGSGFFLDFTPMQSWSYRLAAGANLGSTNPLAVHATTELAGLGSGQGSLIVAPGTLSNAIGPNGPVVIRTGTGSIDIAAAGDLRLGNQASVIYTAGTAAPGLLIFDFDSAFQDMSYPTNGGSVTVNVGRDIDGAPSNQLFTDWLWRTGRPVTDARGFQPAAWVANYGTFEQGIGALGGGDLTIHAGGNIKDLGAVVPSTGIPQGDGTPQGTTTTEVNDGILTVTAGGNIAGGKFLDLAGSAYINAGGALVTGSPQPGFGIAPAGLNPVLALGSGQFQVTARSGLTIDSILDPTLLPRSTLQATSDQTVFATYADSSSVTLLAVGGDVNLANRVSAADPLVRTSANLSFGRGIDLHTLPPTLAAVSLGGDLTAAGNFGLWPGAHGNLELLASGNVRLNNSSILVSDVNPASLPTLAQVSPRGDQTEIDLALSVLDPGTGAIFPTNPGLHAGTPVHGGAFAADGQPDLVPARVVALTGDVAEQSTFAGSNLFIDVPKPIDVVAGRDIVNLSLNVEQFINSSTSNVTAGRDISYLAGRDLFGALVVNADSITVAGPGQLDVQAGRNVNLGTSGGITSVGNVYNSALPATGANLSVAAGLSPTPQYAAFISAYLDKSDLYDQQLIEFVAQRSGLQNPDKAQALAFFEGLPAAQQEPLIQQVLFAELQAGGVSAANPGPGHDNYTRAFTALTTLLPGANPDTAKGETLPYQGDLNLYFSRIYTLAGGNIQLLAPGGQINVGLAVPPTAFGVTKSPVQLGIVAQETGSVDMLAYGDVQVNQSRVFAADGGDILMWSTGRNIDAGRGAKTAISAPPPVITIDPASGSVVLKYPPALTGSGIQTLASSPGVEPGHVYLFAPHGVVNANEAGIVAGNLTIAATAVLGANNISVSGTSVGVPVAVTGIGASLSGASSTGAAATSTAESGAGENAGSKTPQAEAAVSWIDVFVLGLGEEQCKPEDLECLKRQQH